MRQLVDRLENLEGGDTMSSVLRRSTLPLHLLLLGAWIGSAVPTAAQEDFKNFDCSTIDAKGINIQENHRAGLIMIHCGRALGGDPDLAPPGRDAAPIFVPEALGGTDVDLITGTETLPHVTQSETFAWAEGNTVVVNYNDSRTAPACYGGLSWSTDGGVTFTRPNPSPLCTGHGTNFGDPIVVFNKNLNKWFVGDLATGCGGQGIGLWESLDGMNWTPGACAHSGSGDDRESMWVDNTPASPFYGRMYISWNDFSTANANLRAVYSDNGTTWTTVDVHTTSFHRDVQLTGGPDGTVFIAGMDEQGGGNATRTNKMYRSTNGGVSWTELVGITGVNFPSPGDILCDNPYFKAVSPIWRHMGWGQPGVGPNQVVHYAYAQHGAGADLGDIMYIRSTDNGTAWSAPLKLNTDATTRGQWMPSLAVSPSGSVFVAWYDRRNTANSDYERFGRTSPDNGVSFLPDMPVSDVIITQPAQTDPNVQACYAGDYDYHSAGTVKAHGAWTDGRDQVGGTNQQDAYYDQISFQQGFTLTANPSSQSVCAPNDGMYMLNLAALTGYTGTMVTLSNGALPTGVTAMFVPNPVVLDGSSTLTLDTSGATPTGNYSINITGTGNDAGTTMNTIPVGLQVSNGAPAATTLTNPADGAQNQPSVLTFMWNSVAGETYHLQVDNHLNFSAPVIDVMGLSGGSYTNTGSPLAPGRLWHWRVIPTNTCGPGPASMTFSFTTIPGYAFDDTQALNFIGGTADIGNHGDDIVTNIALPFAYNFYGNMFNSVNASSNGNLQFTSSDNEWTNACLPFGDFNNAMYPFWDDCLTSGAGGGIFTQTVGVMPNRTFVIEYRNITLFAGGNAGTWDVQLFENSPRLSVNYQNMVSTGGSATSGIQKDTGSDFLQYSCNTGVLTTGKRVDYFLSNPTAKLVVGPGTMGASAVSTIQGP